MNDPIRKIIHLDMDAFFAAIEERDNPSLRGKPVIVGGDSDKRGVVSTANYVARKFGVHSAMSSKRARELCPQGIFLHGNMEKYRFESRRIREIMAEYTHLVEPVSIDEAYLDVTLNRKDEPWASRLARELQKEIYRRTGLTASAGVSYNKFLAKVASGLRKPAGLTIITPEMAEKFLEELPVRQFHGIGKVTAAKLEAMNIRFGRDLKKLDMTTIMSHFGKAGLFYYHIVRGIDDREVETDYERKSIGTETTFEKDIAGIVQVEAVLEKLAAKVSDSLIKRGVAGKTVTLKVRYGNFDTITRSQSVKHALNDAPGIMELVRMLLRKSEAGTRPVRLLGISVGNFPDARELNRPIQLEFDFGDQF